MTSPLHRAESARWSRWQPGHTSRTVHGQRHSHFLEEPHYVVVVDPSIPVEVKTGNRFIVSDPRHVLEEDHNVIVVNPFIGVQIFIQAVKIGIGRNAKNALAQQPGLQPVTEESVLYII